MEREIRGSAAPSHCGRGAPSRSPAECWPPDNGRTDVRNDGSAGSLNRRRATARGSDGDHARSPRLRERQRSTRGWIGPGRCRGWRPVGGWSRRRDSNPRPTVYETVALPLSYFGTVANGARVYQRRPGGVSVGPGPERDYRSSRRYSRLPVFGSAQTRVASPVVGSVNTSSVRRIEALDAAVDRSSRP